VSSLNGEAGGLSLLLSLIGITVEEHVGHDFPRLVAGESGAETENLTGKEPEEETDTVSSLVVGGNGNVDVLER